MAVDKWIKIGPVEHIPRPGARVVSGPDGNIAVFRTATGDVFALDDRCPHKGGPLSQGIVFGERVACPLHDWVIELKTGSAVAPDVGCASTHAIRIDDGIVWLQIVAVRARASGA